MKNFSSWIIIALIFPCLLISCTDELTIEPEATILSDEAIHRRSLLVPQNNTNPYDTIGRIQNTVLDIYLSANHSHSTIEEINGEIGFITNSFSNTSIGSISSTSSSVGLITDIVNSPGNSLDTIIANSHLTNQAKASLSGFIDSLLLLQEEEYEDIHEFIVTYESSIIGNMVFNNEDKRVILTTSSIARYSFYYGKKRKDKDWETSVGNIAASVGGALENSLTAVSMALATGISQNTMITE
jgi:hypothetical protein